MSVNERNDRANIYIRKCDARNHRKETRRCKNLLKAVKTLYYGGAVAMAYIAVTQFLVVLGH